jgi:hypothetical protein
VAVNGFVVGVRLSGTYLPPIPVGRLGIPAPTMSVLKKEFNAVLSAT